MSRRKRKVEPTESEVAVVEPTTKTLIEPLSQELVDSTKELIRVHLVLQAKRELERVIELTETLDAIQRKYQEKVLQYIQDHDDESAILYLPQMMDNISKCLERSYSIINQVVGNDKIMNYQITQNNINDSTINVSGKNSSFEGDLADPQSREKIRYVMREILGDIDNLVDDEKDNLVE